MDHLPLEIKQLSHRYGSKLAVDNVSFSLEEGKIFGLLGPNGAGKTTIISCITTLLTPNSGKIVIFGKDLTANPLYAKQMIGCVPQEIIHHGYFSLERVLNFFSKFYGIRSNEKHITFLMKKLDLYVHRKKLVNQLSGGMKRRLLIAKALIHRPKILLLDEPTAGVDVDLKLTLWKFIEELKEQGTSILLTTHYLEEAENLCDNVGFLQKGKIKHVDTLSAIMDKLSAKTAIILLQKPAPKLDHPYLKFQNDNKIVFTLPRSYTLPKLLIETNLTMDTISDIHIQEGNLEDVFLKIVNEE